MFQVGRGSLGRQAAPVDDANPVGQGVGLLQVLGSQKNGNAQFGVNFPDLLPDAVAAERIQAGGRFVKEQDAGAVNEGRRQVETPFHSAGVGANQPPHSLANVNQVGEVGDTGGDFPAGQPVQAALQRQQLPAGLLFVQGRLLQRRAPMLRRTRSGWATASKPATLIVPGRSAPAR